MRVIVVVIALAAVAAAAPADLEKFISVYGTPKTLGEFYLPQERNGLTDLFDQSMIISYKSPEKEELISYFLTEGLKSIYQYEELAGLKSILLGGGDMAFLYLSAARLLSMPELSLPVRGVVAPVSSHRGNLYQKYARAVPSVLLIDASRLQGSKNFNMAIEIGQFAFRFEGASIIRDITQLPQQKVVEGEPIIVKKTQVLVQPQEQQYVQQLVDGKPVLVKKIQVLEQPQEQQYVQKVVAGEPVLSEKTQVLVQPQEQQQYVQQVLAGEPILSEKTQVLVQPQEQQYVQQVLADEPQQTKVLVPQTEMQSTVEQPVL